MTSMLPDTIHPDVKSRAERRLFELIRNLENRNRWVCLHSLGLGRHVSQRAGEIDFFLLTDKALIVLEVKGGGVRRQAGVWTFTDRHDVVRTDRRGPFEQARSAMHSLERRLRDHFGPDSPVSHLLICYGVVAPDCRLRTEVRDHEGSELADLVYDFDDRAKGFGSYIDRVVQTTQQRYKGLGRRSESPTPQVIETIVDFVRGDFDAVVPASVQADDSLRTLVSLQRGQYAVLDTMRDTSRCIIDGAAGTGKTLLAAEIARRAVRQSKRVLFLCFNRLLGCQLQASVEITSSQGFVGTVHGFCHGLIRSSVYAAEFEARRREADQTTIYPRLIPEYATMALLEGEHRPFDIIVLDEAQDYMQSAFLDVFDLAIVGGIEAGTWRAFLDSNNQAAVFGTYEAQALDRLAHFGKTLMLSLNYRNTRQIVHETNLLTTPDHIAPSMIEGAPVEYLWMEPAQEGVEQLQSVLDRLTNVEGVAPGRITVLSARHLAGSNATAASCGGNPLALLTADNVLEAISGRYAAATLSTISAFKGLENDFIILIDLDDIDKPWWKSVAYVGMTRARAKLYILLPQRLREAHDRKLEAWMDKHAQS